MPVAIPVSGYTDMHVHLLPAVDDGPLDDAEALALAREEAAVGVDTVVVTPHEYKFGFVGIDENLRRLMMMKLALDEAGVRLKLIQGSEVAFDERMVRDLAAGALATIGGTKHVLIELGAGGIGTAVTRVLYVIQTAGLIPIIAHVERVIEPRQGMSAVSDLAARGCILQVTAASITGAMGRWAKEVCDHMAGADMIHVIASDAHHPTDARLSAFFEFRLPFAEKWGTKAFERIMFDNPRRILAGEAIV